MGYLALYRSGELLWRVREGYRRLASCNLCPHDCGVNRIKGERGICGVGMKPKIAAANVHRGEEPPISGTRGSGTIFLSGCSLKCVFCQNFPISQLGNGKEISTAELAVRMLKLQKQRAHNINFVTPTHFLPQILAALWLAIPQGFNLPLIWNCSGYERVDALELLAGVVSVYLPDIKYCDDASAREISGAEEYCAVNRAALAEMYRQGGNLRCDTEGLAVGGMIIRHLVLPGGMSGTRQSLAWLAGTFGAGIHVSLMNQYFPAHRVHGDPLLGRTVTEAEYAAAVAALTEYGFDNGWVQEWGDHGCC